MTDKPGPGAKDSDQETIFNSGIGDDWGEAFEAEDFMSTPKEEASSPFFLPEEPLEPTQAAESDAAQPQDAAPPASRLACLCQSLSDRFRSTPLPLRLAVIVLPVLALGLWLTLRKGSAPSPPSPAILQQEASHPAPAAPPVTTPHDTPPPPPELAKTEAHPAPEATPTAHDEITKPTPPPPEKKLLRKKWRFPALIVHAKADKESAPAILTLDLNLILKLSPEAMPPADKDYFIRELLYQFLTNQPLDDLQRYALDRGEMNRKLQAWIIKQWPDLPLASVAVERYQLQ